MKNRKNIIVLKMSNFFDKYTNAIKYYNKPGEAQVKQSSNIDYFTDDDKRRTGFKPLVTEEDIAAKYGFTKQHNEVDNDQKTDSSYKYGRNRQVRQVYPSSIKHYNPYGSMYQNPDPYHNHGYDKPSRNEPYSEIEHIPRGTPQPEYYEHPAYAVPKYASPYGGMPERKFVNYDSYKPPLPNTHNKLRQAQTDYYAK